ncbi:type-F conjugative transfer system protein TrbI [Sphingobium sp. RSMS]|uniref:type-F conjugative transfer system protein TrbI n=1 Tax=Sphingobium sp. RSMS TaxID=520734 RepID=UPI0010F79494|nr:type-F conjugative transfer system protein TrbI [Sphingobium sp. RSMS]UXC92182.1 type-F conjugative transfer system protein TrbI [Sphingobium sp. RSMS]
MKNILATSSLRGRLASINLTAVAVGVGMVGQVLWGVWATDKLLTLEKREVVTVQLSRIMGDFIEAEARGGRPPEETRLRVQAYLKAVEASVQKLGREGRTVLVAEAVVAGSTPDLTQSVRADVVRRMGAIPDAAR